MHLLDWLVNLFRRRPSPGPPAPVPPDDTAGAVLVLVNAARRYSLADSAELDGVAQRHASWMEHVGIMAHENIGDLTPGRRLTSAGIAWSAEGECIAHGQTTASGAVASWLASPAHREILLGDYQRLGVGRAGAYWCAVLVR